MPLLKTEADKLSNNDLVAGVIEEIITKEGLFALLPFVRTNGKAYVYNRENTISQAPFVDPNATLTEEASTFNEITTALRIIAGDVDVDKFIQGIDINCETNSGSNFKVKFVHKLSFLHSAPFRDLWFEAFWIPLC